MNTKLKAMIEGAIDTVITETCDDPLWKGWIHPGLIRQMTNAAEQVFDSAMDTSEFVENEI